MSEQMDKEQAFEFVSNYVEDRFNGDFKSAAKSMGVAASIIRSALKDPSQLDSIAEYAGLAWQMKYVYRPVNQGSKALITEEFKALLNREIDEANGSVKAVADQCGCSEKVVRSAIGEKCRRIPEVIVKAHGYETKSEYRYWKSPSAPGFVPAVVPENFDLRSYRKVISKAEEYVVDQIEEGKGMAEIAKSLGLVTGSLRKVLEGQILPGDRLCSVLGYASVKGYRFQDRDGRIFGRASLYNTLNQHIQAVYGSREEAVKELGCTMSDLKGLGTKESEVKKKLMSDLGIERKLMVCFIETKSLSKANDYAELIARRDNNKYEVIGYLLESGKKLTPKAAGAVLKKKVSEQYLTTRLAARQMGMNHKDLARMFAGQKVLSQTAQDLIGASEIRKAMAKGQSIGMGN